MGGAIRAAVDCALRAMLREDDSLRVEFPPYELFLDDAPSFREDDSLRVEFPLVELFLDDAPSFRVDESLRDAEALRAELPLYDAPSPRVEDDALREVLFPREGDPLLEDPLLDDP